MNHGSGLGFRVVIWCPGQTIVDESPWMDDRLHTCYCGVGGFCKK